MALGVERTSKSAPKLVSRVKPKVAPTLSTVPGVVGTPSKITKPKRRKASTQASRSLSLASVRQRTRGSSLSEPSHSCGGGQSWLLGSSAASSRMSAALKVAS